MAPRIPLILLSFKSMAGLGRRFKSVGKVVLSLNPHIRQTLPKLGIDLEPEAYAIGSLISSLLYGLMVFAVSTMALALRGDTEPQADIPIAIGLGMWLVFLMLHMIYPGIILKKIAGQESKDLLYALREIIIDVDSGVPLFDAMKNVGNSDYGYASMAFQRVVNKVESGMPEVMALKELALQTESDYMKRTAWQMINALESGASMKVALNIMVDTLESATYREIKNYSANLNFLMLIYMLVAAVVPSLGITFMVLLSAFGGLGVNVVTILMLILSSAILQVILTGFMSSTRPELFGG